jgi:hypothetical protein
MVLGREVYPMKPHSDTEREPKAPEVRQEQPRRKRFRIVKLEERIAPQAAANMATKSTKPIACVKSY